MTFIYWIAQKIKYMTEKTKEEDLKNGNCCVEEK